jgi:hypothetical protein
MERTHEVYVYLCAKCGKLAQSPYFCLAGIDVTAVPSCCGDAMNYLFGAAKVRAASRLTEPERVKWFEAGADPSDSSPN